MEKVDRYCRPVVIIRICISAFKHCSSITKVEFKSLHSHCFLIERWQYANLYKLSTKKQDLDPILAILSTRWQNSPRNSHQSIAGNHAHTCSHTHSSLEAIQHSQSANLHVFGQWEEIREQTVNQAHDRTQDSGAVRQQHYSLHHHATHNPKHQRIITKTCQIFTMSFLVSKTDLKKAGTSGRVIKENVW